MDDPVKMAAYTAAHHLSRLMESALCDASIPMLVTVIEDDTNQASVIKFPYEVPKSKRPEFSRIMQRVNEQFMRDKLSGALTIPLRN
jgi:hypothetical protein